MVGRWGIGWVYIAWLCNIQGALWRHPARVSRTLSIHISLVTAQICSCGSVIGNADVHIMIWWRWFPWSSSLSHELRVAGCCLGRGWDTWWVNTMNPAVGRYHSFSGYSWINLGHPDIMTNAPHTTPSTSHKDNKEHNDGVHYDHYERHTKQSLLAVHGTFTPLQWRPKNTTKLQKRYFIFYCCRPLVFHVKNVDVMFLTLFLIIYVIMACDLSVQRAYCSENKIMQYCEQIDYVCARNHWEISL